MRYWLLDEILPRGHTMTVLLDLLKVDSVQTAMPEVLFDISINCNRKDAGLIYCQRQRAK